MAAADFRYSSSETVSTCVAEKMSGSHKFKAVNYSLMKGIGIGECIESDTFAVGGYDWALQFYPDGYRQEDGAAYMSLFLKLVTEGAAVRALYHFALLDQRGRPWPVAAKTNVIRTFGGSGSYVWGLHQFVKKRDLEVSGCIKDDCFTIRCTVSVVKPPKVSKSVSLTVLPSSDLHEHLRQLLESREGTDVTFEVGGETFVAHQCVLAARSPVFRAELSDATGEKSTQCRMEIQDMEAVVFEALLHFIYSDSLPSFEELTSDASLTSVLQQLVVAADRYGLERLKLICEDWLCQGIHMSIVATTLVFAEQHRCSRLKAACLEYIASPDVLSSVLQTDEFEQLSSSCPAAVKELLEKLATMIMIGNTNE